MTLQTHSTMTMSAPSWLLVLRMVLSSWFLSVLASGQAPRITYTIMEELPPNTFVGNVRTAAGLDGMYSQDVVDTFAYGILGKYKEYFTIEAVSGILRTSSVLLDRESECASSRDSCTLTVEAAVIRPTQYFQVFTIYIRLEDKNDNPPRFPKPRIDLNISENVSPGAAFVIPTAQDLDAGAHGVATYEFVSNSSKFDLKATQNGDGSTDLRLMLKEKLDREQVAAYDLKVVAKDGGQPPQAGELQIRVNVVDSNDNSPVFDERVYNTTVPEDYPLRTTIVRVHATDRDTGPNGEIVYSLSSQTLSQYGQTFAINRTSGEISLNAQLDYETEQTYTLLVEARDQGPDGIPEHAKVLINVLDVNDHEPQVTISTLTTSGLAQISEWAEVGAFVAHVRVEDLDKGPSGEVSCTLQDPHFELRAMPQNPGQYKILTAATFDYEQRQSYRLLLTCEDGGSPTPLRTTRDLMVSVLDENDHEPEFLQRRYTVSCRENNSLDAVILQVGASDRDDGENGRVGFFVTGPAASMVLVDEDSGAITTLKPFDHEMMDSFVFEVEARDHGKPQLTATATVSVTIIDINDEAPQFLKDSYTFGTLENQAIDTVIGSVAAIDHDSPPYDDFTMFLHPDRADLDTFAIDPRSGQIRTKRVLDREHQPQHYLTVVAANTAYPRLSSTVTVTVFVGDVNDNAPSILFPSPSNDSVVVSAHAPKGYIFTRVDAKDADSGKNAKLLYQIAKGNEEHLFDMDPVTGALSVLGDLVASGRDEVNLVLLVKDQGEPQKSAVASLDVLIDRESGFAGLSDPGETGGLWGWGLGYHQKIIIILGCVTAVLVIILLTAIVILKRKQAAQDKETYKYTCRIDLANRLCNSDEASDAGESMASDNSMSKQPQPKKSVSFDDSREGHDLYSPAGSHKGGHLTLEDLQRVRCLYREKPANHNVPFDQHNNHNASFDQHNAVHKDLQARELFELIRPVPGAPGNHGNNDDNGDSASAASNADSGRGTSEPGDLPTKTAARGQPPVAPTAAGVRGRGKGQMPLPPVTSTPPPRPPRSTGCHGNGVQSPVGKLGGGDPRLTNPATRTNSFGKPCKLHPPGTTYPPPPRGAPQPRYIVDSAAEDNMSDGGSTTSGSYVVELDHNALKSVDV